MLDILAKIITICDILKIHLLSKQDMMPAFFYGKK